MGKLDFIPGVTPYVRKSHPPHSWQEIATANGWSVTLNHRDEYVAHDTVTGDVEPDHILEADNLDAAWRELCGLESLTQNSMGSAVEYRDGEWHEV